MTRSAAEAQVLNVSLKIPVLLGIHMMKALVPH